MVLYFAAMLTIGFVYSKRSNSSTKQYFAGGRGVGPWLTALSAEASDMSGWLLMGLPGVAYFTGAADPMWTAIGLALGTYLNWKLVARRLRRYSVVAGDAITIPDFFSKRFHDKKNIVSTIAALIILVFFCVYVGSCFVTVGKLFSTLFGWDYHLTMVIGAAIVFAYTIIGGYLSVPTVSGGTANTEFEVLTGCSLDFFGAGEFPYYSILRKEALETLATDLRALKYTATGVHNYTGSFYYRNTIYKNMGFNRFHSKEYMNGFELNPKGWCKDSILTDEILKAVRQTEGRDFVYVVTMQTHGAYIPLPADMEPVVTVEGAKSERERRIFEYYLSQLVETDRFVGDLVEAFENCGEKTIIVFFGDHLPGLSLTEDDLTTGDMYKTPYVIWANYELDGESRDLEAYQLGAYALKQAKIDTGVMVRFHQREMGSENYLRNLEMLEYDMLYGQRYVYESAKHAYDESFTMGLKPIRVTSLENRFGNLFVHGEGLTYASRVYVNDKAYDTVPVDDTLIIVPDFIPEDGSLLAVAQVSDEGIELSRTAETVCEGLKPVEYDD